MPGAGVFGPYPRLAARKLCVLIGGLPDEVVEDAERERHHALRAAEFRRGLDRHYLPRLQGRGHEGKNRRNVQIQDCSFL